MTDHFILEEPVHHHAIMPLPLPGPRVPGGITVREAVPGGGDLAFIDQLQKMHSHMVGFLQRAALENYVKGGHVLIAESDQNVHTSTRPKVQTAGGHGVGHVDGSTLKIPQGSVPGRLDVAAQPLGYCIFKDQYLKRDDVGIVYQLNVLPLRQRNLIGATLIKAAFERSAYGCRLFCCWCAQDIQANWFWESIGFVPLAFRTGSRSKQRTHIFWQKRIREGDEVTPYWFPSQTQAGAVGEDRIVLPIPPGTHWRDAKPLILPQRSACAGSGNGEAEEQNELPKTLPGGAPVRPRDAADTRPKLTAAQKAAIHRAQSKHLGGVPLGKKAVLTGSGIKYVERTDFVPELDTPPELRELEDELNGARKKKRPRPRSARSPRSKNDPKFIAMARELRDRFLEEVNSPGSRLLLGGTQAKYDVSRPRMLAAAPAPAPEPVALLDAA
jgi:hypothetical protein